MDFLNPGMLGSQDFFRMEFATPIDKNGDKEAAARLRKLVYPFILRRTKEQVAGDLPDKTEMITGHLLLGPSQYKRSEEHTSELQSPDHLVCRLLLEKKKNFTISDEHQILYV